MTLEGIHHITAITADARTNLDFYTRVMGLRLVKKSVNQDDPTAYHLFYSDELGSPGADLTFFEYPGAPRGRAGAGMVHRIAWRVASAQALDFWAERLNREGIEVSRREQTLSFADPEGLGHTLAVVETNDEPLAASHPEIPQELALVGFDGVRAYAADPEVSRGFLERGVGFVRIRGDLHRADDDVHGIASRRTPGDGSRGDGPQGEELRGADEARGSGNAGGVGEVGSAASAGGADRVRGVGEVGSATSTGSPLGDGAHVTYEVRGLRRGAFYIYDRTERPGIPGAGTVHHVAWSSTMEEHAAWGRRVREAGGRPTPVIDRFYFRSIYFREPSGVLFEIATMGPGFTTDEPLDRLGERLSLPPNYEHLRGRLEQILTPLPNPRERWARR